ncbi:MAG: teichoic acid biosynthesis related protein [Microgenomates bacterium 39_7]|nr:MAG: teichoic acid biosynthesis related protein [Microgenomates bacterium 39_7]
MMPSSTINQQLFFSIVIPTLNEEEYLPKLLEDLVKQTYKNFEVIHVDAESDDDTVKKANKFLDQLQLKSILSTQKSVGHQRNLGSQVAKGSWIIFMDADNRLPDHFLQGVKYQLDKRKDVDAFTCWLDIKSYQISYQPAVQLINFGVSLLNSEVFGAMLGIKAELMSKYNFSEKQKFCEDIALVKELNKDGHNFVCFRDPRYFTSPRRFEKEGLAKTTTSAIEARLRMLFNDNLENFDKYPMLGGAYYEENNKERNAQKVTNQSNNLHLVSLIDKVESFLSKASKKQLSRAKKIWSFVTNEED